MHSRLRLLGWACLRAAIVAAVAVALAEWAAGHNDAGRRIILLTGVGAAVGCAAAGFQLHPRRSLGLIPIAATGLAVALLTAALSGGAWSATFWVVLGLFAGVAGPALAPAVQAAIPRRLPAMPLDAAGASLALLLPPAAIATGFVVSTAILGAAAVVAWALLFVPTLELLVEILVWPMYDVRVHGPGADRMPRRGPLLVIANHSSYADPFWLGKIVPRKATPMMTSVFYDQPVIRWLMVHLIHAIRVQASAFRREAPELHEAADVLRRGGCVLLFPEGILRRREDQVLMPFGQGAWHILKELPQTPVVVCWIEGGWGSWASYCGGPPMKNKRLDFRRRIDVTWTKPRPLDAAVLADHHATRRYLRRACLECRRRLGLPTPDEAEPRKEVQHGERQEAAENNPHPINP